MFCWLISVWMTCPVVRVNWRLQVGIFIALSYEQSKTIIVIFSLIVVRLRINLKPFFFLAIDLEVVNKSPSEIPRLREGVTQQGRHLCLQLSSPTGTGATAMQYIQRTNQLAVGFSDGSLQLWNLKTLKKE